MKYTIGHVYARQVSQERSDDRAIPSTALAQLGLPEAPAVCHFMDPKRQEPQRWVSERAGAATHEGAIALDSQEGRLGAVYDRKVIAVGMLDEPALEPACDLRDGLRNVNRPDPATIRNPWERDSFALELNHPRLRKLDRSRLEQVVVRLGRIDHQPLERQLHEAGTQQDAQSVRPPADGVGHELDRSRSLSRARLISPSRRAG